MASRHRVDCKGSGEPCRGADDDGRPSTRAPPPPAPLRLKAPRSPVQVHRRASLMTVASCPALCCSSPLSRPHSPQSQASPIDRAGDDRRGAAAAASPAVIASRPPSTLDHRVDCARRLRLSLLRRILGSMLGRTSCRRPSRGYRHYMRWRRDGPVLLSSGGSAGSSTRPRLAEARIWVSTR